MPVVKRVTSQTMQTDIRFCCSLTTGWYRSAMKLHTFSMMCDIDWPNKNQTLGAIILYMVETLDSVSCRELFNLIQYRH